MKDNAVAEAGHFPRIVSHEDALNAARDLIAHYFGNEPRKGGGVLISIPARADNTDLLLIDYIMQQQAAQAQRVDEGGVS